MIEAYEIGIRLALDDGISAGVQAIRRELIELDRVVEASAVRLASLRAAAGLPAVPSVAEPPRSEAVQSAETEEPQQPARPVVAGPEPADEQPDVARRGPSSGLAVTLEKLDDAPATASAPSSAGERQLAPAEPVADAGPYRPSSAATSEAPEPLVVTPPAETAAPTAAAPIAHLAAAPTAQGVAEEGRAAPSTAAAEPSRDRGAPQAPEPSQRRAEPDGIVTAREPAALAPPPPARPIGPARPPPSSDATPSRSAAPAATPVESGQPRRSSGASHPRASGPARDIVAPERADSDRQPSAPKAGEDADQRTMEVYIYLEGAPLGRWMADQLDRAASRPAASLTGFDPRVSPAWPGAPIG